MGVFRVTFSSTAFEGPRAQEYSRPEDLFQQLVGDALREMAGPLAHVALTSGRDGGIDTWVENPGDPEHTIFGMPTPLIVECKYHDEAASDPTENTRQGCRRLITKLQKQAKKNWSGLYAPWNTARGYLYCVSNRINQTLREELTANIREFFQALPEDRRPPLAGSISVMDWGDLAGQLNRLSRITDAWLGVRLENILGHEEYVAGLKGFRVYLKETNLNFVPPRETDPVHPQRIFEALSTATDKPGIIIDGPGGVGKTRTALEVAGLAHSAGWRVFHVFPGEPPVTTNNILTAVTAESGNVLLVLDYIDQMRELDFGDIGRRVIPETEKRSITLALLANKRPATSQRRDKDREALFEKISLKPDYDRECRISENIRNEIAPTAIGIIGEETVRRLCGRRPIIAMFVARELEICAKEGTLTAEGVADIGEGDLITWLRKRLDEARLSVPGTGSFLPSEPTAEVVAAAAALASAPLRHEGIITASSETLTALAADRDISTPVVDMLITLGWLEETPQYVETAHDVVCDEVLERVLRIETTNRIYNRALAGFLAPALSSPRVFGRYAVALARLLGASRIPDSFRAELESASVEWLGRNAATIGATLAEGDPDESAYAMGAAFVGVPWGGIYVNFWNELLKPWIDKYGGYFVARHLYYRLLKFAPKNEVAALVGPALKWVEKHGDHSEASFVLPALLECEVLSEPELDAAVKAAVAWLEKHGLSFEAGFLLRALLDRVDFSPKERTDVIAQAVVWLGIHNSALEAKFVLHPLLSAGDLSSEDSSAVVKGGLAWLDIYGTAIDAEFVIRPFIERSDLLRRERTLGVTRALEWIEIYGGTLEARSVLGALLGRSDLSPEERARAVKRALDWLNIHGSSREAGYVLPPLLQRDDLSSTESRAGVTGALEWLELFPFEQDSEFVLKPLLTQAISDVSVKNRCAKIALSLFDRLSVQSEANFILRWLLNARALSPAIQRDVVEKAFSWLRANPAHPHSDYVLKPILRDREMPDSDWRDAALMGLSWLKRTPPAPDRDYILNSLLLRASLLRPEELGFLITDALAWLESDKPNRDTAKSLISSIEKYASWALPRAKLEALKRRWGVR